MTMKLQPGRDDIGVYLLAEGEQSDADVMEWLADFIAGARSSLDFAMYDFRLSEPLQTALTEALRERAQAGVSIRIAYDAGKPAALDYAQGMDPATTGTGAFVESLGYPWRRIAGMKLMHHKYILRDAASADARVWTGSTNLTDDAWTLEENNIVQVASPEVAAYYTRDFAQLWQTGEIGDSGDFDESPVRLAYAGSPALVGLRFSPGRGRAIDWEVAHHVATAQRRVRICSMLLNSGALIAALSDVLRIGEVPVDGVYDATQMEEVYLQWQDVPHNHWKTSAVQDIVRHAHLVGKRSTPYTPTSRHDFMHNKVLVVDDMVITGSYNFSHSAELNAENILMIQNAALAERYSAYIDHLQDKYGGNPRH